MPTYDYHCPANDRTVEVSHKMAETVSNWGELCRLAGIEPGDTPADSPVKRLISGAAIVSGGGDPEPPCASGGCCPGGQCGL